MTDKKFHEYVYEIENWVDEFAIAFLSFGTIVVLIWSIFLSSTNMNMVSLGNQIDSWVVMLALMVIARELWLLNRNLAQRVEG